MTIPDAIVLLGKRGEFDGFIVGVPKCLLPEATTAACLLTGRLDEVESLEDLDVLYREFCDYMAAGIFTEEQLNAAFIEVYETENAAGERQAAALMGEPSRN